MIAVNEPKKYGGLGDRTPTHNLISRSGDNSSNIFGII
jgi:hypothetical protein